MNSVTFHSSACRRFAELTAERHYVVRNLGSANNSMSSKRMVDDSFIFESYDVYRCQVRLNSKFPE